MDLPDCRNSYPGFRYAGDPFRRRTGQKCLLAVRRRGRHWNNSALRGNNPGPDDDRHEYGLIDERQIVGPNGGYSPAEHRHTARSSLAAEQRFKERGRPRGLPLPNLNFTRNQEGPRTSGGLPSLSRRPMVSWDLSHRSIWLRVSADLLEPLDASDPLPGLFEDCGFDIF